MSIDSEGPPSSLASSSSSSLSSVAAAEASSGSAYQTADEGFELTVISCRSSVEGTDTATSKDRASTDGEEELGLVMSYSFDRGRDEASLSSGLSSSTPTVDADSIDSAFAVTDREDWTPVVETSAAAIRDNLGVGDGKKSSSCEDLAVLEYTARHGDPDGIGRQSDFAGREVRKPEARKYKTTVDDAVAAEGEASVKVKCGAKDADIVVGANVQLHYDSVMPVTSTARATVVVTPEVIRPVVIATTGSHSRFPLTSETTADEMQQLEHGRVSSFEEPAIATPQATFRSDRSETLYYCYTVGDDKHNVSRREADCSLVEGRSKTVNFSSGGNGESMHVITSISAGASPITVERQSRNAPATPSGGVDRQAPINDGDCSEYYRLSHRSLSFDETLTSLTTSADAPIPIPAPRRKRMAANRSVVAQLNRKHSDSQFIVSSRSAFDDGAGGATTGQIKPNIVVEATVRVIDVVVERHEAFSAATGGNDGGLPPLPPSGRQRHRQNSGTDVGGKRTNRSDSSDVFEDSLAAAASSVTAPDSSTADGERRWSVGNQRQHQHQQQHHHHHVNLENLRKSISLK
jgi:hypothetical protein